MIDLVIKQFSEQRKRLVPSPRNSDIFSHSGSRSRSTNNRPTEITHCLHCGTKLLDSMWGYSGKRGKYLCYNCWYFETNYEQKLKYEKKAQEISRGGGSRQVVNEPPREILEVYTHTEDRIDNPTPLSFPQDNKLVQINKINLDFLFSSENMRVDNTRVNSYSQWCGAKTIKEAFEILTLKSPIKRVPISNLHKIPYNEIIINEGQKLVEFNDMVGFYPNVPAYIQGHPLNMYNNQRTNKTRVEKSVNVYFNITIDSKYSQDDYYNKGVIAFNTIEKLIQQDIKVNLLLLDCSYIKGETLMIKVLFDHDYLLEKRQEIYEILTQVSFLRIVSIAYKKNLITQKKLSDQWMNGFGYSFSNQDLRKVLHLYDDDPLFNEII